LDETIGAFNFLLVPEATTTHVIAGRMTYRENRKELMCCLISLQKYAIYMRGGFSYTHPANRIGDVTLKTVQRQTASHMRGPILLGKSC
jgi:hypothetical protein